MKTAHLLAALLHGQEGHAGAKDGPTASGHEKAAIRRLLTKGKFRADDDAGLSTEGASVGMARGTGPRDSRTAGGRPRVDHLRGSQAKKASEGRNLADRMAEDD